MNVVVIRGGIVGITTAYALIKRGHQVCILERNGNLGLETSFANGGQLSYRYVSPLSVGPVAQPLVLYLGDTEILQGFVAALCTQLNGELLQRGQSLLPRSFAAAGCISDIVVAA